MTTNRFRWLLLGICLLSFSPVVVHGQDAKTPSGAQAEDPPTKDTPPEDASTKTQARPVQILTGRIIHGETGKPITDATIAVAGGEYSRIRKTGQTLEAHAEEQRVFLFFTKKNGKRAGKTKTDAEGRFSLKHMAYGTYHAAVIHPDYECALIDEVEFAKGSQPIVIRLSKAERIKKHTITGHVKNASGQPVSGGFVALADTNREIVWQRGETESSEGDMWIYQSTEGNREYDWFIEGEAFGAALSAARTNEQGAFEITGIAPGTYNLAAAHKTEGIRLIERVEITKKPQTLEITLEHDAKQTTHTLKGRLVDEAGKPVGNVPIAIASTKSGGIFGSDEGFLSSAFSLWPQAEDPYDRDYRWFSSLGGGNNAAKTRTNADGTFSFKDMLPGGYHLAAAESGLRMLLIDEVKIEADSKPLELVMKDADVLTTMTFKGRVVDHEGNPVSSASIGIADAEHGQIFGDGADGLGQAHISAYYWNSKAREKHDWFSYYGDLGHAGRAKTDEEGRFSVKEMLPGTYNMLVVHTTAGATAMANVKIEQDAEPTQITLGKPTFVEGTLTGLSPITEALSMRLMSSTGLPKGVRYSHVVQPDAQGRFRAGPLLDTQDWMLMCSEYVRAQGYTALRLSAPLDITQGETTPLTLDLGKNEQISGQVLGPKGEPLSGVSVLVHTPGNKDSEQADDDPDEIPSNAWAYGTITDKLGMYTIKGVPKGDYILRAKRHAKRTAPG